MLKLKLQYFGQLIGRTESFATTLMLGKIEGRRRGGQRMRWLDGITNWMLEQAPGVGDGGRPGLLQPMGLQRVGHD